jgi:HJR/Mrr/RecB family endonuclease
VGLSAVIGFIVTILILISYYFLKRMFSQKSTINLKEGVNIRHHLRDLDPYKFEEFISALFKTQGYKIVRATPVSQGYGAEILMEDNEKKYVVEIKKYDEEDNLIETPALQNLQAISEQYKASGMKFVTLGHFSKEAEDYAKKSNIQLINGDELINMYNQVLKIKK